MLARTFDQFHCYQSSAKFSRYHYETITQLHRRPCHISTIQSGFCKHYFTNTMLIKIRDNILNALDRGEVKIAVITDFSKAFNTVDCFTLLRKLHSLNISTPTLNLIGSYLTDSQYVQVNEQFSSHKTV